MSTGESRKYHFFVMLVAKRFRRVHTALRNIQSETPLPPFLSGGYERGVSGETHPGPSGHPSKEGICRSLVSGGKKCDLPALCRGHPAWLPIALATDRHNRTQRTATQHEPADGMQHVVEVKLCSVKGATAPGFTREVMQPGTLPERLLGRNRRGCTGQGALILPDFKVGDHRVA